MALFIHSIKKIKSAVDKNGDFEGMYELGFSNKRTFLKGLILVVIWKLYLQSSHDLVSALLIHCCRQAWWTYLRLPAHTHGDMRGMPGSASQWQIRQTSPCALVSEPCEPRWSARGMLPVLGPKISCKRRNASILINVTLIHFFGCAEFCRVKAHSQRAKEKAKLLQNDINILFCTIHTQVKSHIL